MNLTFIPNRSVTLVTSDFRVLTATKDNPNWPKIEVAIRNKDEDALIAAISIKDSVCRFGKGVEGRGDIEIRRGQVFYRGVQLFGEDVNRILSYLTEGFPEEGMIHFLEAKLRNVSPSSVASLYMFLENKGMPITDNGTVLGYKGVRSDYCSVNTGSEPLIEGIRNEDGSIINTIGSSIAMDRCNVCADNGQPCGPGLHIGSKQYATTWAGNGHVMVVEFSPEHVVSVPTNEHEKLRVYKYKVVGELKNDFLGNTYNNDYVRPHNSYNPDDYPDYDDYPDDYYEDENDLGPILKVTNPQYVVAPVTGIIKKAEKRVITDKLYNVSDWSKGQSTGYKDGKAHQKRMFYEEDSGRTFKKYSKEFVSGYLRGYRDGR